MKKLIFLAMMILFGASAANAAGAYVGDNPDGAGPERLRNAGMEPISVLSEKLGVDLVCYEGFLHARNGASYKILMQSTPFPEFGMLVNSPIRCVDGRFFPKGLHLPAEPHKPPLKTR